MAFVAALTIHQNRQLVKQNRDLVEAADREAGASADTVAEMQRQRESSFKPALTIKTGSPPGGFNAFVLENIGTGPAFNVKLCAHMMQGEPVAQQMWMCETTMGIAAGSKASFTKWFKAAPATDGSSPDRYRCLVGEWWTVEVQEIVAVQFEDWFGTYYRVSPRLPVAQLWRPNSDTPRPDWVHSD